MDQLDKLIDIKLKEQFLNPNPFPYDASSASWFDGRYAPSTPVKDRRDIDDEEKDLEEQEKEGSYARSAASDAAMKERELAKQLAAKSEEAKEEGKLHREVFVAKSESYMEELDRVIGRVLKEETPDIVKKQRDRGVGKLAMQKSVKEDEFEVEPHEASKLHKALEKEHLDKMHKFDEVIKDLKGKMAALPKNSGDEYKKLHSMMSVNKVEQERHRQHAHSHRLCRVKHKKLEDMYDKGIPSDEEIDKVVHYETV
jgi:hypothetical protein